MKAVIAMLVVALAALVAATTAAAPSTSASFFMTGKVPEDWTMLKRAEADEVVPVVFAIKLNNVEELYRHLDEVSDPRHERYGQHLSIEEVNAITSNWDATARVFAWLLSEGVDSEAITLTKGGDFVHVTLKVREAERILDASFHHFEHAASGLKALRTPIYRLPGSIRNLVDFMSSSTMFPNTHPRRTSKPIPDAKVGGPIPAGYTTPDVIVKAYNIDSTTVASTEATQAVYENLDQSYNPQDLQLFFQQFNIPSQTIYKVIGPNDPSECTKNPDNCGEASLDVDYIMGLAVHSPTTYWSIPSSSQTPFLDWVMAMAQADDAPLVTSISYGSLEPLEDPSVLKRFCDEVTKLGTRGITVIAASGDDGVANFQARSDKSKCGFTPSFPAACPALVACGADMGPESGKPEVACTSATGGEITTGGGFSTVFDMPSYQKDVVTNYLANGPNMPPTSMFASTGRAYPDVALTGFQFVLAEGGQLTAASGTSASAPTFAAMITLINGKRISAGKKPLGFINPVLYQLAASNPSVFNDITEGENNCCAGAPQGQQGAAVCCDYGFTATTGWDPLTGLGSVNFGALSDALTALP